MSIEQDWAKIRERAGRSDMGTTAVTRCIVDLADKVQALQDRVDEMEKVRPIHIPPGHWVATVAPERTPSEPDPSDWVGDLCMFDSDIPPTYHHGPFVYNGISSNGLHRDEVGHGWLHCRPATEAERIRYKGEPPTESREICMTRASDKDSWTGPRHYVGMAGNGYYVVEYKDWGNFNCVKYARKCTPEEAGDMKPLEVPEEVRG